MTGLLLVLIALLVFRWRRRRKKAVHPDKTARRWELITDYGQIYPSFLFILNCFRQHHELGDLLAKPDVEEAMSRLEALYDAGGTKNRRDSTLLLFPVPAARSSQVKAVLLTILRGIFDDEELSQGLPPQAHQELDRFLDSLAEGGQH